MVGYLFWSHIIPGSFTYLFGVFLCARSFQKYFVSLKQSTLSKRMTGFYLKYAGVTVACGRRIIPLEGLLMAVMGIWLVIAEFISNPVEEGKLINPTALFHVAFSLMTAVTGIVDCLIVWKIAPKRLDYFWRAFFVYILAFQFYNHYPDLPHMAVHSDNTNMTESSTTTAAARMDENSSHKEHPFVEVQAHRFLALLIFMAGLSMTGEVYYGGRSVLFAVGRGTAIAGIGLWFFLISFVVYLPSAQLFDLNSMEGAMSSVSFFMLIASFTIWQTFFIGWLLRRIVVPEMSWSQITRQKQFAKMEDYDDESSDYEPLVCKISSA